MNIEITWDGQTLTYRHDGRPFSMQDLAALLSGGSSKDFDSTETTGRFGTGFLLTHAISLKIELRGVVTSAHGLHEIVLRLDRSGDDDAIYANTTACNEAIKQATPVVDIASRPTALFTYIADSPETVEVGLRTYEQTLPYLYGTCAALGKVTIVNGERSITFDPGDMTAAEYEGVDFAERSVRAEGTAGKSTFRVLRVRRGRAASAGLVLVLNHFDGYSQVAPIAEDFPRLFCRFPIRGSQFLPIHPVIDGAFTLSPERDDMGLKPPNDQQVSEALGLLPSLALRALADEWRDAHLVARVGMPQEAFGDALKEPEKSWWRTQLSAVATDLALCPIVEAHNGERHKVAPPTPCADFVFPRFDAQTNADEVAPPLVWELARELEGGLPPRAEISADWSRIVSEWSLLGVRFERLDLSTLADYVRKDASKLDELKVVGDKLGWLVRFLSLVSHVSARHNCASILARLLPDQNGNLRSPTDLYWDEGISSRLKDLSARIGMDVRDRLLSAGVALAGERDGAPKLSGFLKQHVSRGMTNADVVRECLSACSKNLPDSQPISPDKANYRDVAIDLLQFFWDIDGAKAAQVAQTCPLVAADGSAVRWSAQRKLMAPVAIWPEAARSFASVYRGDRILSDAYCSNRSGELVGALLKWEIAFPEPLVAETKKELRDAQLRAISVEPGSADGVVVHNASVTQIALLPTELLQRSQTDEAVAKALLGLAVVYVAKSDSSWHKEHELRGRKGNSDHPIKITPALWLADLKSKAWVPVPGENGSRAPVIANAGNLEPLLDPAWLVGNDAGVLLLSRHFGFNELQLRLLATAPSPEARQELESGLAQLVQIVGADPSEYAALATELEVKKQREAEKSRNRQFGLAVQDAIRRYLESRNLGLHLEDRGYDYDVFIDGAMSIDAGTHHLAVADYVLEVKATTTGEVRLTPTQAAMSTNDRTRFVLCVVDLRGVSSERMLSEWTADDVEPRAKIVIGVGALVDEPHSLVTHARECEVGLRNDAALRYGVPTKVWDTGISIASWVDGLHPASNSVSQP